MSRTLGANQRDTLKIPVRVRAGGVPVPLSGYDIEGRLMVGRRTFVLELVRGDVGELELIAPAEAVENVALAWATLSFSVGSKVLSTALWFVDLQRRV